MALAPRQLTQAQLQKALEQAIALQKAGEHAQVIALLARHESEGANDPHYATVRGISHRALGEVGQAAHWFEAALDVEPRNRSAAHGRARTALQRGESDALTRFDHALSLDRGNGDLWLGKAQALEVAGDIEGALSIARQLCDSAPGFIPALSFYSGLQLARAESDFTAPFAQAAKRAPQDPNIAAAHIETLAGLGHYADAAQVAKSARSRFPTERHFALMEATHTSASGDLERAEAIFATLPQSALSPNRQGHELHEARHRIRSGDWDRALGLVEQSLTEQPWAVSAWALRGILWRLTGDVQAQWLHEQAGLVELRPLIANEELLEQICDQMRNLHQNAAMPLGQSLRGGTQTRGILFQRTEKVLTRLHAAIIATLEDYRCALPEKDGNHPLLRHRDATWQLAGSWSVRLTGGGDHHASHIHRQGIVSSALYLVVPEEVNSGMKQGWLEIGRPPDDLKLDLPPLHKIAPKAGHLALFPATLYHGTTRFGSGERISVAFDGAPVMHNPA